MRMYYIFFSRIIAGISYEIPFFLRLMLMEYVLIFCFVMSIKFDKSL